MLLKKLFVYTKTAALDLYKHKYFVMTSNKYRAKEKFSLNEKKELGALVEKYKKKYDGEVAALRGQTTYDYRTKKHEPKKPKQSFLWRLQSEISTATLLMLNIMTPTY